MQDRRRWTGSLAALVVGAAVTAVVAAGHGASAPPPGVDGCGSRPEYHRLDFWLGDWRVYVGPTLDGENHIEAVLGGCAIEEHWHDVDGHVGQSWFFVDPGTRRLRQIWVSDAAYRPGSTRDKAELPPQAGGAVRFEGRVAVGPGRVVRDRTTLLPLPDGTVRQRIEVSRDDGAHWALRYDAVYRRIGPARALR